MTDYVQDRMIFWIFVQLACEKPETNSRKHEINKVVVLSRRRVERRFSYRKLTHPLGINPKRLGSKIDAQMYGEISASDNKMKV